jgi:hypothetical protein
MKKYVLAIIISLFAMVAGAQESQTAYNFLRLPVSAHEAALGGENVTIYDDDLSLIFSNPALLTNVSDKTIGLNYMNYMAGVNTGSAAFNRVVGDKAAWAVSGQLMSYGTMREVDANNVQTGEFSAKDIALGGYFSYLLTERLTGGITAKFIYSAIADYHSMAVGVDIGLNYTDSVGDLSIAVAAKNLGGQVKAYDDEFEKIPFDLQVGVTKRLTNSPFRFSATLSRLHDWDQGFIKHLALGADVLLSETIYLAAGYNFRRAHEMKITEGDGSSSHGAGLSFGAGISLERFKLHIGYGKYHVSAYSLLFNASYTL